MMRNKTYAGQTHSKLDHFNFFDDIAFSQRLKIMIASL